MCDVTLVEAKEFPTLKEERDFKRETREKIKKGKGQNVKILFLKEDNIKKYLEKTPRAKIWQC